MTGRRALTDLANCQGPQQQNPNKMGWSGRTAVDLLYSQLHLVLLVEEFLLLTTRGRLSYKPSKAQLVLSQCYLHTGYPSHDGGKKRIFQKQHNTCRAGFLVLNPKIVFGRPYQSNKYNPAKPKQGSLFNTCAFDLIDQHV